MGTEVARRDYLSNNDFFDAFADQADSIQGGEGGKAFMKFNGDKGEFSYGADNVELLPATQLVMNPRSFKKGWVIWSGGHVVHEVMRALNEGPPPSEAQLPDHGPYGDGDGPVEQFTIDFSTTEEPFVEMVFQANNASKRRALGALIKTFRDTYKTQPGKWPVVEIDSKEFEAKIKNSARKVTKYAPSFKIITWITEEEMAAMKGEDPAAYEEGTQIADQSATETAAAPAKAAAAPKATAAKPAEAAKPRARGRF